MADNTGTGVVVGRFQVPVLNQKHIEFFNTLLERHERIIVFLGSNPAVSIINAIDVEYRVDLFFPNFEDNIEVAEMPDLSDDRIWSQELDRRILEMRPNDPVTVYGSTDGFIERYSGRYKTVAHDLEAEDLPEYEIEDGLDPTSFRTGILYAHIKRFPTVYPTVDIAMMTADFKRVLLARKDNETRFRFPGGFVDPDDENYEMAAVRELYEECGDLVVDDLDYIGSARIDDWRYRDSPDCVITHLYCCIHVSGEPEANDDIAEVRWFNVDKLRPDIFVAEHQTLYKMLVEYLFDIDAIELEDSE
jgi:bifunctional NMN adenylyltransferase/nudix hydrolase